MFSNFLLSILVQTLLLTNAEGEVRGLVRAGKTLAVGAFRLRSCSEANVVYDPVKSVSRCASVITMQTCLSYSNNSPTRCYFQGLPQEVDGSASRVSDDAQFDRTIFMRLLVSLVKCGSYPHQSACSKQSICGNSKRHAVPSSEHVCTWMCPVNFVVPRDSWTARRHDVLEPLKP